MTVIRSKKNSKLKDHDPAKFFKRHEKVAEALLMTLEENDAPAFLEILNTYLYVNRTKAVKEAVLSRPQVCK